MSISKNIKKLLVAGVAVIMAASAGANLNNVSAKRRSRYHYRTHRVYRKHAKRSYLRRIRKHTYRRKRARRHVYRRRGRATGRLGIPASYIYHINRNNTKELQNFATDANMVDGTNLSVSQIFKKYSRNGKSINALNQSGSFWPATKSSLKDMELNNHETLPQLISSHVLNKGRVYYMMLEDSEPGFYTKDAIAADAHMNHMSASKYIHKYIKHASKWWHLDGTPTKLALQTAERDAINDLNQQREARGVQPVTQDPTLEFIAHKRLQLESNGTQPTTQGWHGNNKVFSYASQIEDQYHIPWTKGSEGENVAPADTVGYQKPSAMANDENTIWGPEHRDNRDSAAYNYAGIGIGADGGYVEEFRR